MLIPAPPHPVPAGPLAVRWLGYEEPRLRAGERVRARVELENAGSATWRSQGREGIQLAYHWLDPLGNAIVWDGVRTPLPRPVAPGERLAVEAALVAPMPPGEYRLAFDLVEEYRFWFADVGNAPLEVEAVVLPRLGERRLRVEVTAGPPELAEVTQAALTAQEEPPTEDGEACAFLAAGCRPAPDWSRRILDAHEQGYVAVAGSIELEGSWLERRRLAGVLEPWAPGFGRVPEWSRSLLCPSLLVDARVGALHGLPAVEPAAIEGRVLCDGRIRITVPARALARA